MDDSHLYSLFEEQYQNKNIIEECRALSIYSIKPVCFLTGINRTTYPNYAKSNKALFNASFKTIVKLSECFELPISIFKEQSSFAPFNSFYYDKEDFFKILIAKLIPFVHLFDKKEVMFNPEANQMKEADKVMVFNRRIKVGDINYCLSDGSVCFYLYGTGYYFTNYSYPQMIPLNAFSECFYLACKEYFKKLENNN